MTLKLLPLFLSLGTVTCWSAVTPAADLAKIDRAIAKEPVYKTEPKYCLLVFGPEAKTRVWLVVDGDVLYVDRNGNGDLTETGKQVRVVKPKNGAYPRFEAGDILEAETKIKHTGLTLMKVDKAMHLEIRAEGKRLQIAYTDAGGVLQFADQAKSAPIVHINGPLTMGFVMPQLWTRGKEALNFQVAIGTPGLGNGTFACMGYQEVPNNAHPLVKIDFPAGTGGMAQVRTQFRLTHRC